MGTIWTMEEMLAAAAPKDVMLSGWNEGEEVHVKLRRPSLINMATGGQVPNPLIGVVAKLLTGSQEKIGTASEQESSEAMKHIARAALAEPTLKQLEEAGVSLTDQQYMEIYAWVLGGLEGLDRFRQRTRGGAGEHAAADAGPAERDAGPDGQLGGVVRRRGHRVSAAGAKKRKAAEAPEDDG